MVATETTGTAQAAAFWTELTAKERHVGAAMAAGWTNATIASRLVLSPKTIERRVSAIYGTQTTRPQGTPPWGSRAGSSYGSGELGARLPDHPTMQYTSLPQCYAAGAPAGEPHGSVLVECRQCLSTR